MPTLIKGKYEWSFFDIKELKIFFPKKFNNELAEIFKVSPRTIIRKARELGLVKENGLMKHENYVSFGRKGSLHPNSIATQFKKGQHVSQKTEFKPKKYINGT